MRIDKKQEVENMRFCVAGSGDHSGRFVLAKSAGCRTYSHLIRLWPVAGPGARETGEGPVLHNSKPRNSRPTISYREEPSNCLGEVTYMDQP